MHAKYVVGLAGAAGLLAVLSVRASEGDPSREVRALALRFVGMVRTENPTPLEAVADMLADEFVQITSSGRRVQGKAANMAMYTTSVAEIRQFFSRFDGRYEILSVKVHPQAALVTGKLVMTGRLKENGRAFDKAIWESLFFEKGAAGWRLVLEHSTRVREPKAARPAD